MKNSKLKLDAFLSDSLDRKLTSSVFGGDMTIIINIDRPIGPPKVTTSGPTGGMLPPPPPPPITLPVI